MTQGYTYPLKLARWRRRTRRCKVGIGGHGGKSKREILRDGENPWIGRDEALQCIEIGSLRLAHDDEVEHQGGGCQRILLGKLKFEVSRRAHQKPLRHDRLSETYV